MKPKKTRLLDLQRFGTHQLKNWFFKSDLQIPIENYFEIEFLSRILDFWCNLGKLVSKWLCSGWILGRSVCSNDVFEVPLKKIFQYSNIYVTVTQGFWCNLGYVVPGSGGC